MYFFRIVCLALIIASAARAAGPPNVLTWHNDRARTGQNPNETILTPGNVNSASFGKLFMATLDGLVDAQPLYVAGVSIPNQGTHNVLIAATENDSVYALDADTGATIWHSSLLATGETPSDDRGCGQVTPQIGITSTPVISLQGPTAGGTIYAAAMSKDSSGSYHQRLHALALTTGKDRAGSPVEIQAKVPGHGPNSSGGFLTFDPSQYKERSALLLMSGTVYLAWASHCDHPPYNGWIMGYNASTLAQTTVLNITPNGTEAAIWGSGAGLAADSAGNIIVLAANGTFDTKLNSSGFPASGDFGNAFLKLSTTGGQLAVADYFTMYNTVSESQSDTDLGSGGALVVPNLKDSSGKIRHLAVGAGKDGNMYIADRDNMGKFNPQNNNNLYQELAGVFGSGVWSTPAYFKGRIYYGAVGDSIRAYQFNHAVLSSTSVSATSTRFTYPGATPSISANGTANGIVWAVENTTPAVLHAYSADNLAQELYNSNQALNGRDQFGAGNKFMVPTIANGKVYVGTPTGVAAFGLLNGAGNGRRTVFSYRN